MFVERHYTTAARYSGAKYERAACVRFYKDSAPNGAGHLLGLDTTNMLLLAEQNLVDQIRRLRNRTAVDRRSSAMLNE